MQSLKKMVGLSSWATDTWEVQPVGTAVGPMGGARPRPQGGAWAKIDFPVE